MPKIDVISFYDHITMMEFHSRERVSHNRCLRRAANKKDIALDRESKLALIHTFIRALVEPSECPEEADVQLEKNL